MSYLPEVYLFYFFTARYRGKHAAVCHCLICEHVVVQDTVAAEIFDAQFIVGEFYVFAHIVSVKKICVAVAEAHLP